MGLTLGLDLGLILSLHLTLALALGGRNFKLQLPAFSVNVGEDPLKDTGVLELLVLPVEPEGGAGVLDGVVAVGLDVFPQDVPGEETQRELALAGPDEVELDCVDDLRLRHVDVDDPKVLGQAVPDEDAAQMQQQPQLLVGDLQRYEVVRREGRVEIARLDPRVRREVVDDRLRRRGDVVVDERHALVAAASPEH